MTWTTLAGRSEFVDRYREQNKLLLQQHPEFATWLDTEYVPLAGGWQY